MKLCKVCGETSLDAFYPQTKSKCKRCYTDYYLQKYRENIEAKRAYQREWVKKNRDTHKKHRAINTAKRRLCRPTWLNKDDRKWEKEIRSVAREVSEATAETYEVDHIVPLVGRGVCGLDVPWNLQIIPKSENCQKSNRLSVE